MFNAKRKYHYSKVPTTCEGLDLGAVLLLPCAPSAPGCLPTPPMPSAGSPAPQASPAAPPAACPLAPLKRQCIYSNKRGLQKVSTRTELLNVPNFTQP